MNEFELSKNVQLDEYKVKDLNVDPKFPFEDSSFDVVTCVVSVDYLNKPLEVRARLRARGSMGGGPKSMSPLGLIVFCGNGSFPALSCRQARRLVVLVAIYFLRRFSFTTDFYLDDAICPGEIFWVGSAGWFRESIDRRDAATAVCGMADGTMAAAMKGFLFAQSSCPCAAAKRRLVLSAPRIFKLLLFDTRTHNFFISSRANDPRCSTRFGGC